MLAFGPSPDSLARSNDLFFGGDPLDPQPDWTDLSRVAVPQADEQQRLLANMIIQYSITPTPRFWRRGTATRSPPWGARDTCGPRAGA